MRAMKKPFFLLAHTPRRLGAVGVVFLLLFAAFTRLYGNNWDQGQHLHPDERFLTMVAIEMQWPTSFGEYLDTAASKLNPHNTKFDFYVYGTWPVIFVKFIAEKLTMGDYANLTLVGRALSGIVDLITLLFVFLIGKRLGNTACGLFAVLVYTLMALPIQLSHFYTTDPYLTLFLTISLYILLLPVSWKTGILLGMSTGLALSAKISGIVIFPVIALSGLLFMTYKINFRDKNKLWITIKSKCIQLAIFYLLFIIFFVLSFRLLMPYLFTNSGPFSLNPKVLQNWDMLKSFNDPNGWFPPAVQWINQQKVIYPLLNLFFVGLGLPMGILCFFSLAWSVKIIKNIPSLIILLFFVLFSFFYHATGFAFPMRYFWPVYPVLAVIAGVFLSHILHSMYTRYVRYVFFLFSFFFFLFLVWPLSVLSIYSRPHTRVLASKWIYEHIPAGSRLSHEHWDDPLPLHLPNSIGSGVYERIELPMYYEDTPQKWREIQGKLDKLDYIILSSNRVYGSITSAPDKYPRAAAFYEKLFAGNLGFQKVAEFTSRPSLSFPLNLCIRLPFFKYASIDEGYTTKPALHNCTGIEFIDDYVEESWTVYDHPKVTIFKKI
jgi:hypothetical protein